MDTLNYGLSSEVVAKLHSVFIKYPEIEKVVLYGSRAKGNFRKSSDIDLTVFGTQLNDAILSQIGFAIDDLLLPYTVDLSIFWQIQNSELKSHIERVGVHLFKANS